MSILYICSYNMCTKKIKMDNFMSLKIAALLLKSSKQNEHTASIGGNCGDSMQPILFCLICEYWRCSFLEDLGKVLQFEAHEIIHFFGTHYCCHICITRRSVEHWTCELRGEERKLRKGAERG